MNISTSNQPPPSICALRKFRAPHSAHRAGFTLIELLVVIGIIALLAGLVVGGVPIAQTKMRRSRVEAEREQLISAIESYKKAKGYYPPDNPNTPVLFPTSYTYQNTLFYELTGCTNDNGANGPTGFTSTLTREVLPIAPVNKVQASFNVGGIFNSSTDPTAVVNYFPG